MRLEGVVAVVVWLKEDLIGVCIVELNPDTALIGVVLDQADLCLEC